VESKRAPAGQSPKAARQCRIKVREMKAKIFEVILHKLSSGQSPAITLEEQINTFLAQHPNLRLVATHMSTLVTPAGPNAMPRTEESSIIIFCTLFYTD
jgi:hypothetical protein